MKCVYVRNERDCVYDEFGIHVFYFLLALILRINILWIYAVGQFQQSTHKLTSTNLKKKMKATQRGHIALISYSCVDQVDIYNSIGTMAITELAWKCMEVSSKGLLSNVYIHLIVTIVYTGAWFANAVVVVLVKIRPYFHNLHPTATGTVYLHKSLLLLHLSFHFLYVCLVFGRQVSLVLVQRTCIMKIV